MIRGDIESIIGFYFHHRKPEFIVNEENKGNDAPWHFILLAAMAGGIGWGIRGQYGHETGAAMAVLHVMLVIGMWFVGRVPPGILMKALALATLAGGFGG